MAVRAAKKKEEVPTQMELVKVSPEQKRERVTNLIAEYRVEKIKREQVLGQAKLHKNRMTELLEEAEKLSAEASTGQINLELQEIIAQADSDDLEGRVFDQANIRTIDELTDEDEG